MRKFLFLILIFLAFSCSETQTPVNTECKVGETKACYTGTKETQDIGICKGGTQTCNVGGKWGECENQVLPTEEICDGLDNDCNGVTDDNLNPPVAEKTAGVCQNSKKACDGVNGWIEPDYTQIENYETNETKCDGLDNDCDGGIDNNLTPPLSDRQDGICKDSVKSCDGINGWKEPNYTAI